VKLGKFAIASYVAIIIMFIIHLLLLFIAKLNPTHYVKKGFPTLTFAFSSRSSTGTLPFSIKTQTKILVCLKELRTLLVLLAFQPVKMVVRVFIRPC
jgi:L-cystine uptake protein TcyP (sodium:dicarboxylate symporter family)